MGMKEVEDARVKTKSEADKILQKYEKVGQKRLLLC